MGPHICVLIYRYKMFLTPEVRKPGQSNIV